MILTLTNKGLSQRTLFQIQELTILALYPLEVVEDKHAHPQTHQEQTTLFWFNQMEPFLKME